MRYKLPYILVLILIAGVITCSADDIKRRSNQSYFNEGNSAYEKRDYAKAIESYFAILDAGIESGDLYYNIGNSFFKIGKMGYAILCYERAHRIIPGDRDLKVNLEYAYSVIGGSSYEIPVRNIIFRVIDRLTNRISLRFIFTILIVLYVIAIASIIVSILVVPFGKKFKSLNIMFFMILTIIASVFLYRYYWEKIISTGIVLNKTVECKYEPIEKSTTFYSLKEGDKAYILKTKNDWRQIKRLDGKIGWVKKAAIDII